MRVLAPVLNGAIGFKFYGSARWFINRRGDAVSENFVCIAARAAGAINNA